MIDVWFSHAQAVTPHALDEEEHARAGRFLCERTAATYRSAHTLARRVLSHYRPEVGPAAWRFGTNTWGKPAVAAPALAPAFNLSHSDDRIAIAVADAEVGVDIERLRPLPHLDDVARHVFHPRELRWLARQPHRVPAFFRLWTLKEALLKAGGTGFSHPPKRLCWQDLDGPQPIAAFGGRAWIGASRTIDDAAIVSIAVPSGRDLKCARLLRPRGPVVATTCALDPIVAPLVLDEMPGSGQRPDPTRTKEVRPEAGPRTHERGQARGRTPHARKRSGQRPDPARTKGVRPLA